MVLFGERKPFNLTNFVWVFALGLVFVQAFGLVLGKALGLDIRLGPVFLILFSLVSVYFGFGLALNKWRGFISDRKDVVAFLVLTGFVVFAYIMLPKVAPEFFRPAAEALQSMVLP